uniref:Putative 8.9 kDa family member n=1 Tax=Rhipicephalus pulchellus TaxID=72859 RepID=L7M908_RHIPC
MHALFALVVSVIVVTFVMPDLSEEAVGVQEVRMHHEICHYKRYRIEDGRSLALIRPCLQLTCESVNASYANVFVAGCGALEIDLEDSKRCSIRKPRVPRPYPRCCPRIMCRRIRREGGMKAE